MKDEKIYMQIIYSRHIENRLRLRQIEYDLPKRIIEETEAGLVFRAGDHRDLADKLIRLYNSPELCQKLGRKGKKAATEGRYSWRYSGDMLINLYKAIVSRCLHRNIKK